MCKGTTRKGIKFDTDLYASYYLFGHPFRRIRVKMVNLYRILFRYMQVSNENYPLHCYKDIVNLPPFCYSAEHWLLWL